MLKLRTKIKLEDIKNIEKIVKSTKNFSKEEINTAKELAIIQLANPKETYRFIFLEDEKEVLGYTCFGKIPLTEDNFDLYWIAVLKKDHSKGLGSILMEETEKIIKKQKGRAIYIETSSNPKYKNTRKFYLKNGYKQIAKFPNFYKQNDAKIVYIKVLTPKKHQ